jgi:hypothetical protein
MCLLVKETANRGDGVPLFCKFAFMRQPQDLSRRIIKKLENEIVSLDRDYTALLKKKWRMEEEIRKQKHLIADMELTTRSESEKGSFWKKVALILAATWAVFLSVCGIDRK